MQAKCNHRSAAVLLVCHCLLLLGIATLHADTPPAPAPAPAPAAPAATPPPPAPQPRDMLSWDAVLKELKTTNGQAHADFSFAVTNISESDVVIDHVATSCGCTVAKLPSQPWVITPHAGGAINVSVNLAGKSGTIYKTTTVYFTNGEPKQLTTKVDIAPSEAMVRSANQQIAAGDHQAVFKGDCAKCHADPAKKDGKELAGKELYDAVCTICHEPAKNPRASSVPDLHAINHPTGHDYFKQQISSGTGKPGSMMPAFSKDAGGPLSADQIESLATYLAEAMPGAPAPAPAPAPPAPPAPK